MEIKKECPFFPGHVSSGWWDARPTALVLPGSLAARRAGTGSPALCTAQLLQHVLGNTARENPDSLALTASYLPRNTNGRTQAQFGCPSSGEPFPWERGVWELPCATVLSRVLRQKSSTTLQDTLQGFQCLGNLSLYPCRSSTLTSIGLILDKELALLWYTLLQSTTHRQGLVLVTEFCFAEQLAMFQLATVRHIWPSCWLKDAFVISTSSGGILGKGGAGEWQGLIMVKKLPDDIVYLCKRTLIKNWCLETGVFLRNCV